MTSLDDTLGVATGSTPIDAVLFDMDGVVTDTARVHAAAWKRLFDDYLARTAPAGGEPFRPFDADRDYREFVDGKPREDGVADFLASRGIVLPVGDEDAPDADTVRSLAARKDGYFRERLAAEPARAFPGTVALLDRLRAAGIPVAVFSASRNAEAVLSGAGVLDRFAARVDGRDLRELDLPGKPDPASLLEAAARLGVDAGRTAVVEDALAGVEAGRRGGFGLVVGVDRSGHRADLLAAGADIVVEDLAELEFDAAGLRTKLTTRLPPFLDSRDGILDRLAGRVPLVFLDYDGTLTPIVEDYTAAYLPEATRRSLAALAERCPVAIVSGRDLAGVRELVGLDGVYYAGSHGFEIAGPAGFGEGPQVGMEFLPELDAAERELRDTIAPVGGAAVERKRFSIAVHYRKAAEGDVPRVAAIVDQVRARHPRLRIAGGKKVHELRPDVDWDKGRAVEWLRERIAPGALPFYFGDDLTDEDAFRALAVDGVCAVVRDVTGRPTAADYSFRDVTEVRDALDLLAGLLTGAS